MTKYRIILTALALIFNITGAHCQKKYFRVENGLPSDFIVSMNVDENGTVWIGTEEGMCSFNGVDIKTFNSDLLGQPSNYVLPDRNDESIWVATQRSGFGCYDPVNDILRSYQTGNDSDNTGVGEKNSKGITPPHDILTNEITYLCQDEEGNIWYSTYTKGMGKYNKADDSIEFFNSQTVEGMEDFSIISFAIGADYKIYAGHYNRGITIIDTKTKKATHLETSNSSTLPTNQIGYVLCDNDNNVWVGTSRGVALYRPVTNDFMVYNMANSGLPDNHIFSMYVTSDRRLLVSPNFNGVWYANIDELHDNPQFKPLPEAKDIMNLPVRGMAEDRFGNLWLGSYGRGVLFVGNTASDFKMISNENDAASSVSAFIELRDRGYAIGLVGGGIDILDSRLRKTTSLNKFLSNSTTTALTQDSSGNIWVGTFSGRIQLVDEKLRSSITIPILEARDFLEVGDTMWVASGLGLYSVNKRTNEIINRWSNVDNTLPDIYLRCLCMDCYGRLWVGSYRSGIMVFDKDMNLMTRIMTDEPSFSNQVNDLFYDGLFTVYAATGDGLVIYDISGDTIVEDRVIRKTDRISSNFIKSVTQDDNLGIWFSTNLSICRYDEIDGSVTEYKNHYGSDFSVGNFNGNVACIGKDGVLSFGNTEGLVRFEPIAVIDALQAPTVHFREISIINRGNKAGMGQVRQLDRDEDKKLKLAYQERSFSLLFATDDYSLSGLTDYICEIDGKELYQPSGANHIVFSDLAPGNHSISIKSRIGEAEYGPEDSLEINIRHSIFWNLFSQLFYLLCLIALAVMIMVRYKRHLAEENKLKLERKSIDQQKDVDNERLRFYTNITHELRTPLTLILGPIRDIAATELPQGIATKIQIINKNASRLMELVNQLLDFRKVETSNYELKLAHGDISMAVENVGRIFAESNVNKNITFVQNISKNVIGFFDQEILTVILNNLLSNAFKYTEKGEIALEMKEKDGQAVLSISDTGYGIAKDKQQKVFERYYQIKDGKGVSQGTGIGLSLVKSLVELHNGSIELQSHEGMGSHFTVCIPIDKKTEEPVVAPVAGVESESSNKGPVVVVVEDNDDIREYIAEILHKDYEVFSASNGQEALPIIETQIPDLVITDIMMPIMDGLTLCRKIKHNINISHIPIILLTAKDTMQDRSEGYNSGGDSYITKPFTSELLISRIRNLLDTRRAIASGFADKIGNSKSMKLMEKSFSDKDNKFLKKIREIIEENLSSEQLTVEFLADKMNMSVSTLYRKLKNMIGVGANDYIRKIRMHRAAEMLKSGDKNVSEASWSVGINSLIYFRQSFKNEFGITPSEFMKDQRPGGGNKVGRNALKDIIMR